MEGNITQSNILWEFMHLKWNRRSNFYGATLIATGVQDPVYEAEVSFFRHKNGTVELESGMAVSLYRILRDLLNFTEMAIVGEYIGEKLTDTGILGMETYLERGDADIAITESGVNENNAAFVDLLHPTTILWLEARFSMQPKSKWHFFLTPFHSHV
ncbi:unnamed protein product, partial [Allacma fusca]